MEKLGKIMDYIIGSKYLEKRQRIRDGIREDTLESSKIETGLNLECLLCGEQINGTAWKVREYFEVGGKPVVSRSFVDDECYQDAKHFHYDEENKTSLKDYS